MSRDEAVLEIEAIRLNWKGKKSAIPVMLHRWEKQDKIIKLKNGLYIFSEKYRRKEIFEPWISKNGGRCFIFLLFLFSFSCDPLILHTHFRITVQFAQ